MCNTKKSRFIRKQEAQGLLSNMTIRRPLSKMSNITRCFTLNAII